MAGPEGSPAPSSSAATVLKKATPDTDGPAPIADVLAQADRIAQTPPALLADEISRLSGTEETTLEGPLLLAMALIQTRQPVDTARALGLVQRVLVNGSTPAQQLHSLARVLEARLLQQRKLEEQVEKLTQQLRDTQRRNDLLNERLEAVRAIERSLTARPVPAGPLIQPPRAMP